MCINCLKRALNDIMTTEHVIAQTGGSKVVALQAVAHPCCSNPRCRKEGHCHLRVRRADLSVGEWVQENGSIEALRRLAASRALALEEFEQMFEADQTGLPERLFAALEQHAARHGVAATGECAICMEALDASATVGGFARASRVELPCGHRFHAACLKRWAAKHTTCPCCRTEVTEAAALESWGVAVASVPAARDAPRAKGVAATTGLVRLDADRAVLDAVGEPARPRAPSTDASVPNAARTDRSVAAMAAFRKLFGLAPREARVSPRRPNQRPRDAQRARPSAIRSTAVDTGG